MNIKSYAIHRLLSFLITLSDPNPVFKVKIHFEDEYLKTVQFTDKVTRTLIGNYRQAIELYHFRWPSLTLSRISRSILTNTDIASFSNADYCPAAFTDFTSSIMCRWLVVPRRSLSLLLISLATERINKHKDGQNIVNTAGNGEIAN